MTQIESRQAFKEYCHTYYRSLQNPFSDASELVDPGDLDAAIEVLDSILAIGPSAEQFRALEGQFYSAFRRYVTEMRTDIGSLANTVDRLANLIEPFLKKIAYHFLPSETVDVGQPAGTRVIPLWKTSSYPQIIDRLGLLTVSDIYKDQPAYWGAQTPGKALLRLGFASRHRGAHESRFHSLTELERTAHAVIGQYLVISLHLLHHPTVSGQIREVVEKAAVTYILRERARSFPLTGALLSRKEHLLMYRHRRDIVPESHERKFLFMDYLAGHGPVFYWLQNDRGAATDWARSALGTSSEELVRKNAIRYLLRRGERVAVADLLAAFGSYADKTELAQYLRSCITRADRRTLLELALSRRSGEEVLLESRRLFLSTCERLDAVVKRLATSGSVSRQLLLRMAIPHLAKPAHQEVYQAFPRLRDRALQLLYIYCLGEVGTSEDAEAIDTWLRKRPRDKLRRAASVYAQTRIYGRLRQTPKVYSFLRSRSLDCFSAAVDALTRQALGPDIRGLIAQSRRGAARRRKVCHAILCLATKKDLPTVRAFFASSPIDNNTRDLLLGLCRIGTVRDCRMILRRIGASRSSIDLFNHVRIADAVALIAGKGLKRMLCQSLESSEFWNYIGPDARRPRHRLPVLNVDNQALMRRLLAACFTRVASRRDLGRLKRLLTHYYDWIAHKAAERLSGLGREADVDELNEKLLRYRDPESSRVDGILQGLVLLDRRLYGGQPYVGPTLDRSVA
jgi:hypothetical protein